MKRNLISIIIVNWNSSELLRNCLNSIKQSDSSVHYEIIVIDNDSSDNSVSMVKKEFRDVILVENEENVGFAKAVNAGIKKSHGNLIFLLNSDCELKESNTLEKVKLFFAQESMVGILGLQMVFPDGIPQASGGQFVSVGQLVKQQILFLDSPVFHRIKNRFRKNESAAFYEVDYVSGACLFVKRDVINDIGLFNDDFFMYGEDMEFCHRAKQRGWRVAILATVKVVHLKSQSTKKNLEKALLNSIKNNCFLVEEFGGRFKAFLAHAIYSIGLVIRLFLAFFRKYESPECYGKVLLGNLKLQFQLLFR